MTQEHTGGSINSRIFTFWRHPELFKRLSVFECSNPECSQKMVFPRRICPNCGKDMWFLGKGIVKSVVSCSRDYDSPKDLIKADVEMGNGTLLAGIVCHGLGIKLGGFVEVKLSPNGNKNLAIKLDPLPERKPTR